MSFLVIGNHNRFINRSEYYFGEFKYGVFNGGGI